MPLRKSDLIQVKGTKKDIGRPKVALMEIIIIKMTCQLRKWFVEDPYPWPTLKILGLRLGCCYCRKEYVTKNDR